MNIYQNLINNASIGFGAVEKRLSRSRWWNQARNILRMIFGIALESEKTGAETISLFGHASEKLFFAISRARRKFCDTLESNYVSCCQLHRDIA